MQLISLNTWGGKVFNPLIDFVKSHSTETDIFCFQEVLRGLTETKEFQGFRVNLLTELRNVLKNYNYFYCPRAKHWLPGNPKTAEPFEFGQALFIKNTFELEDYEEVLILKTNPDIELSPDGGNLPVALQHVTIKLNGNRYLVANFHGISVPGDKLDTPLRITQSQKIVEFLKGRTEEKILCGDFNLMPQTESIEVIEKSGMINLVKNYNIKDTRGPLNIFKNKAGEQKFADYIFVSASVKVNKFEVPQTPVSDHLPMLLNFG